jgi:hypothetical protein
MDWSFFMELLSGKPWLSTLALANIGALYYVMWPFLHAGLPCYIPNSCDQQLWKPSSISHFLSSLVAVDLQTNLEA